MDCILFKDDGTTELMKVKDDQWAVNIPIPDSMDYIGYDIRRFSQKSGNDQIIYLVASLEVIDYRLVMDAINEHKPQPIELKQNP